VGSPVVVAIRCGVFSTPRHGLAKFDRAIARHSLDHVKRLVIGSEQKRVGRDTRKLLLEDAQVEPRPPKLFAARCESLADSSECFVQVKVELEPDRRVVTVHESECVGSVLKVNGGCVDRVLLKTEVGERMEDECPRGPSAVVDKANGDAITEHLAEKTFAVRDRTYRPSEIVQCRLFCELAKEVAEAPVRQHRDPARIVSFEEELST
jgi:hypothetical protein